MGQLERYIVSSHTLPQIISPYTGTNCGTRFTYIWKYKYFRLLCNKLCSCVSTLKIKSRFRGKQVETIRERHNNTFIRINNNAHHNQLSCKCYRSCQKVTAYSQHQSGQTVQCLTFIERLWKLPGNYRIKKILSRQFFD